MENRWVRFNEFGGIVGKRYTDEEIMAFPRKAEDASHDKFNGWYVERIDSTTIHAKRIGHPNCFQEYKLIQVHVI